MMSLLWNCFLGFLIFILLLVASPRLRGLFISAVFPLLYKLYNSEAVGFKILHQLQLKGARGHHVCVNPIQQDPQEISSITPGFPFFSTPLQSLSKHIKIYALPSLIDNYSYAIVDEENLQVAVVDAADEQVIISFLEDKKLRLTHILTTHKHWDHAGANIPLKQKYPDVEVVGSKTDSIPCLTLPVEDQQVFSLFGDKVSVKTLNCPCHTKGHVVFLTYPYKAEEPSDEAAVFTGDVLFIGSCGKFFEGSAKQMEDSLHHLYQECEKQFPLEKVKLFCGHEYTVSNLYFAMNVEPNNRAVQTKYAWAVRQLQQKIPTIPSTLADELTYNPFLRVGSKEIQQHVLGGAQTQNTDSVTVLQAIRERKNQSKKKED